MMKVVFGLSVSLATFFCGFLGFEIFHLKNEVAPILTVEEVKRVEIPIIKSEQLPETKEIKDVLEPESQNFSGWYALDNYKGMNEVQMISLSRDYYLNKDGTRDEDTVLYAGVFTSFENYGDQGFFDSASAEISGNKVKFRTNKIRGIEYRFKGVFFKDKMPQAKEKALHGTLQKFVKGKKVAEVSGDFAYYEPHCWH